MRVKRMLAVILSAVLTLSCIPFCASAAAIVMTGGCGRGLTYTLDANGVMDITGKGSIKDSFIRDGSGGGEQTPIMKDPSGVRKIIIHEGVTGIGVASFRNFSNVISISIPASLTTIAEGDNDIGQYFDMLYGLEGLDIISVAENNPVFSGAGHCLIMKKTKTLIKGSNAGVIPDDGSVETIKSGAFAKCEGLTSVVIPEGVTVIGSRAFAGCTSLSEISIPESVETIGNGAFDGTAWYESQPDGGVYIGNILCSVKGIIDGDTLTVREGTVGISDSILKGNTDIGTLILPDGLKSIGDYAFSGCTCLESVNIPDSIEYVGCRAFYSTPWYDGLPDGIVYFGKNCSGYKGTMPENTVLEIAEGTEVISDGAFRECSMIKEVIFPCSLKKIGNYSFHGCRGLTSVVIPDGVTYIGPYAFASCSSLTEVTVPDSVTEIGQNAFTSIIYADGYNAVRIVRMICNEGTAAYEYAVENNMIHPEPLPPADRVVVKTGNCSPSSTFELDNYGVMLIKGTGATVNYASSNSPFYSSKAVKKIVAEEGISGIGSCWFTNCASLEEISLPAGFRTVGKDAFSGCTKLTEFSPPSGLRTIGNYAFSGCTGLTCVCLREGLESIGENAFADCTELKTVYLPKSIKEIKGWAFENCSSLTDVYYSGSEEDWSRVAVEYGSAKLLNADIHFDCEMLCDHNNTEIINAKDVTAKQNGYSGDTVCTDCGAVLETGAVIISGDVNGDGRLTTNDVKAALRFVAELAELDEAQQKIADFNGDGRITTNDAKKMLRKIAGLE